jgi:hypothetical protein
LPAFSPEQVFGSRVVLDGQGQAKEKAMGQRLQPWRSGRGERQWLSMLIDTMEKIARPEVRALPNDQLLLKAVRAHLARPAPSYPHGASAFSFRN